MIPIAKPFLAKEEADAASAAVLSGWVTQGPKVSEFEEKFAAYVGAKYAVAVSNCTTALHLALIVAGVKRGDEVICPSMTHIATANAVLHAGAVPVFCEVIPETYNMNVQHAEKLVSAKTKAIILVHQIGLPADIDAFRNLSARHGLQLIEDAACAVGSEYKGRKIGSHSDLVCFSFHPRKVITTGDGGMITTSDERYYHRLRLLRQHGMSVNDRQRHTSLQLIFEEYLEPGYNYRLTDIQAAVGICQLGRLDYIVAERRKTARYYQEKLGHIPCLALPSEKEGYFTNFQSYSILLKDNAPVSRDELMQRLLDKGIASRRGVMTIHREKAYGELCRGLSLPVTEHACDRSIIIPLYVPMEKKDMDAVVHALISILC